MSKSMKIHNSAIERFEQSIRQEQDRITKEFFADLQARMEELSMSQADMAFTLGKSRAYVSKLFTKGQNLTIKTMVELSHSLDMKISVSARRMWLESHQSNNTIPLHCKGWTESRTVSCAPSPITDCDVSSMQTAWNDLFTLAAAH